MGFEGIEARVAVAGVTFEVVDDEFLVVAQVARHVGGIDNANCAGHGAGGLSCNGEVGRVHEVRGGATGRHGD